MFRDYHNFISPIGSHGDKVIDMKLYLKLYFASEGKNPLDVLRDVEAIGFSPVVGDYDCVAEFKSPEEYGQLVRRLHMALKGSQSQYTLNTKKN